MTIEVAEEIDAGRVRSGRSLNVLSPIAGESGSFARSKPSIPLMVDRLEGVPYLLLPSNESKLESEVVDMADGVRIGGEATDEKVEDACIGGEKTSTFRDRGVSGA